MKRLTNILGLLGLLGTGCVVEVGASRGAYQGCDPGDLCAAGLSCSPITAVGGVARNMCTATCTVGGLCPAGGTCIVNGATGLGQCFLGCASSPAICPSSTVCGQTNTTPPLAICVAGTTGTACGGAGQACCSGNACSAGLTCQGGSCAMTTVAQPYQSCSPPGAPCAGGTACLQALARGMGTPQGNTCTITCTSGQAAMCPGYVPGAAVQSVECVNLTGNPTMFQCVRLCNSGADCTPYGSQCLQVTAGGGAPIRICAP
jgi:hypothetical protein